MKYSPAAVERNSYARPRALADLGSKAAKEILNVNPPDIGSDGIGENIPERPLMPAH